MKIFCRKCREQTYFRVRKALKNTLVGYPDFLGDKYTRRKDIPRGSTATRIGRAVRVTVHSCSQCGHSFEN